jgi:hypothetical protein
MNVPPPECRSGLTALLSELSAVMNMVRPNLKPVSRIDLDLANTSDARTAAYPHRSEPTARALGLG